MHYIRKVPVTLSVSVSGTLSVLAVGEEEDERER